MRVFLEEMLEDFKLVSLSEPQTSLVPRPALSVNEASPKLASQLFTFLSVHLYGSGRLSAYRTFQCSAFAQ